MNDKPDEWSNEDILSAIDDVLNHDHMYSSDALGGFNNTLVKKAQKALVFLKVILRTTEEAGMKFYVVPIIISKTIECVTKVSIEADNPEEAELLALTEINDTEHLGDLDWLELETTWGIEDMEAGKPDLDIDYANEKPPFVEPSIIERYNIQDKAFQIDTMSPDAVNEVSPVKSGSTWLERMEARFGKGHTDIEYHQFEKDAEANNIYSADIYHDPSTEEDARKMEEAEQFEKDAIEEELDKIAYDPNQ